MKFIHRSLKNMEAEGTWMSRLVKRPDMVMYFACGHFDGFSVYQRFSLFNYKKFWSYGGVILNLSTMKADGESDLNTLCGTRVLIQYCILLQMLVLLFLMFCHFARNFVPHG